MPRSIINSEPHRESRSAGIYLTPERPTCLEWWDDFVGRSWPENLPKIIAAAGQPSPIGATELLHLTFPDVNNSLAGRFRWNASNRKMALPYARHKCSTRSPRGAGCGDTTKISKGAI